MQEPMAWSQWVIRRYFHRCVLLIDLICAFSSVKFFDSRLGIFLLRTPRENFHEVWSSLTFITSIARTPLTISVVHTSGKINKKSPIFSFIHSFIHSFNLALTPCRQRSKLQNRPIIRYSRYPVFSHVTCNGRGRGGRDE